MTAPLSREQRDAIDLCFAEGLGLNRAAVAVGVSETTIARRYRALREMGITRGAGAEDIALALPESIDIPPEVIADRDRRAELMPRDLVGWICGDPLPGYSSLERQR